MIDWHKYINQRIESRKKSGLLRSLKVSNGLVDFCSNNYLGLAHTNPHSLPHEGSGGSRLLSGNTTAHQKLEEFLATFHGADAALVFNSGYDANLGLLSSLLRKGDTLFYDEYIHASFHDGMKMSQANCIPFAHNNLNDLEAKKTQVKGKVMVLTESVFSMDGDQAPLRELSALSKSHGWALVVDEAHATGIFGNQGEGVVQALGIEDDIFARIHTFGKAVGAHGATVLGSPALKEYLINYARPLIYSTAFSAGHAQFVYNQYQRLKSAKLEREKLQHHIHQLSQFLKSHFASTYIESQSAIQCLIFSGNENCRQVANALQSEGFDIRPVLSPTVPRNKERIRICLHSFNTVEDLERLIDALSKLSNH